VELLFGLILLLAGGESLVRGSVNVARHFGISELMIGLTLVGFGTSTPELVTSIKAAMADAPGIAVGNVVGSNIANILLILGVAAVIYPITCQPAAVRRDGAALIASALCCVALALYGVLSLVPGLIFLGLIIGYIFYTYSMERASPVVAAGSAPIPIEAASQNLWISGALAIGGIALTIYGAKLLVEGAIDLARAHGISEATIGLTIVAVGTSLPELVTSVMAAIRKNGDIALGNVIGSNIFNIWFILGITALIHPIPVPKTIAQLDIWVMLAVTLALVGATLFLRGVSRTLGILFLFGYCGYIVTLL